MAVTPDGKLAISASTDHTLKVWELTSGRETLRGMGQVREVKEATAGCRATRWLATDPAKNEEKE